MSASAAGRTSTVRTLSVPERRWWLLEQLLPDGVPATVLVLRLVGQLDEDALSVAIACLGERHPVLAARVELRAEVPVLLSTERAMLGPTVDVREESTPIEAARGVLEAEGQARLDSAIGPLLTCRLIRVGPAEWWMVVRLHVLAADAASRSQLLLDLQTAYAAALVGAQPVWRSGSIGAAAKSAADLVTSGAAEQERPIAAAAPLVLPADAAASTELELPSRFVPDLGLDTAQSIRVLAAAVGAAPGDVCRAALAALLSGYAGAGIVALAVPTPRGPVPAAGVGQFEEYAALPVDLSDDPSFRTLVRRTREGRRCASPQGTALELLPRLPGDEGAGADPRFVEVAFRDEPDLQPPALPGLTATVEVVRTALPPFQLVLTWADPADRQARLDWWFAPSRFHQAASRVAAHFETLLRSALANPDLPVSRLDLLPGLERAELERLGRGAPPPANRRTVPGRFAEIRATCPEAEAVRGPDGGLSYAELDAASDRLAQRVRVVGAGHGTTVGVCLDRSASLVVALLGVLKTGAAYLPLDPTWPVERIELVLNDAGCTAVVTARNLLARLPGGLPALLCVDDDGSEVCGAGAQQPLDGPDPADPAYVIYTSGSTGLPKGVVVRHESLSNLLTAMAAEPGLGPGQTMVGVTTPAFDLSVPDLFLPLVTGARLVLAEPGETVDGVRLAELLDRVGADLLQATPSTWRLLLDSGWRGRPGMRAVIGGEAVPAPLAARVASRTGGLWNFYGPTEGTVWSTAARLDVVDGPGIDEPVSIGRPLPGVEVAVLDRADRLVPIGIPGELLIGGVGVATGYHARPELTGRRFVRLPGRDGRRMYRSGDLARWRPDGWLEFLGRIDHQVKLRGHRIELGEVEAALRAAPGIRDAVVLLRGDGPDSRLVAYVVGPAETDSARLRGALSRRLPAYMVPTAYVVLDALPRTPNGKLDRAALPGPAPVVAEGRRYVAPRTPVETAVATVWAEVLGVERVGVHDDFFDLGGHSLLVLRVAARLPRVLPVTLPVRRLFELRTVESLAVAVTQEIAGRSADSELADLLSGLEAPTEPSQHPQARAAG